MKIFDASLAALSISMLYHTPVFAQEGQDAVVAVAPETVEDSPIDTTAGQPNEDIVVTGSRVARNGYNTPTPVTIVSTEQLAQATPTNIPDALNKLPIFSGSSGQRTINNGGSASVGNFLNLRSFGVERTLILMDGRRVPATNFTGTVDTNTLPQMLVQRVDVVTGGASAVYGSDAVTGVVNFVLDNKFEGLKAVIQKGISERGDVPTFKAGVAGGLEITDRIHVIGSFEHYENGGLSPKESRPYGAKSYSMTGAGTEANPYTLTAYARNADRTWGGYVLSGPFAGSQWLDGGVLGAFNHGAPTGTAGIEAGGDGSYGRGYQLLASLKTDQAFGRIEYDVNDDTSLFVHGSWARSVNKYANSGDTRTRTGNTITIFRDNAYLPAAQNTALANAGVDSFTMSRFSLDFGLNAVNSYTEAKNVTVGAQGKLADLNWEIYYSHGEGKVKTETVNNSNNARFYAAADAVVNPANGEIVCKVTLTNPGLYPGCVPINLFGVGSPSQAAIDYIQGSTSWTAANKLDNVAANVSGTLFSWWAGDVSFAVGAEYRSQTLDLTSTADPSVAFDRTGLRGVPARALLWRNNTVSPSSGKNNVKEANVELVVPLVKDLPLIRSLELNGAGRYTDYSTSGVVKTWKLGLNYSPIDDLRIRVVRSRDIRAPSLYDLFANASVSPTGFTDPHTSSPGSVQLISSGNPDLKPEVAETFTAGFVYRPSWLPRFGLSVDYYNIKIDNAITSLSGGSAAVVSECENSGGTSLLCSLIVRPLDFSDRTPANYPIALLSRPINAASIQTRGVDVEVTYVQPLDEISSSLAGSLSIRALAAFQPKMKIRTLPSSPVVNTAGAAAISASDLSVPSQRYTIMAEYALGNFKLAAQTRIRNSMKRSGYSDKIFVDGKIPAVSYTDLNISYTIPDGGRDLEIFLNIQNLFDKQPRLHITPSYAGNPGFGYPALPDDDVIGRYFTVGARLKL